MQFPLVEPVNLFPSAATTILTKLFSSMSGYSFVRLCVPGRKWLYRPLIVTMMMPKQVVLVPLFIMMVPLGWQNSYQG